MWVATSCSRIPTARVIAISEGGRNAYVHEMCVRRTVLLDVSAEALAAAIAAPPPGIRPSSARI